MWSLSSVKHWAVEGSGGGTDSELNLCSVWFLVFLEKVPSRKGQAFRAFVKKSRMGLRGVMECRGCSLGSVFAAAFCMKHVLNIENS